MPTTSPLNPHEKTVRSHQSTGMSGANVRIVSRLRASRT